MGGLVHSQRVLLALTQAGLSREESYALVQRNAMKVWESDGQLSLLDLLKADPDVSKRLSAEELDGLFDLGYHMKSRRHDLRPGVRHVSLSVSQSTNFCVHCANPRLFCATGRGLWKQSKTSANATRMRRARASAFASSRAVICSSCRSTGSCLRASENIHHLLRESHVTLIDEPLGKFRSRPGAPRPSQPVLAPQRNAGIARAYAVRLTDDPDLVDIAFQLSEGRVLLEAVPSPDASANISAALAASSPVSPISPVRRCSKAPLAGCVR